MCSGWPATPVLFPIQAALLGGAGLGAALTEGARVGQRWGRVSAAFGGGRAAARWGGASERLSSVLAAAAAGAAGSRSPSEVRLDYLLPTTYYLLPTATTFLTGSLTPATYW